jgi:maltokinase
MTGAPSSLVALLPEFLERQRWFSGKGRDYQVAETDWARLHAGADAELWHLIATVRYADGSDEDYQIPVGLRRDAALTGGPEYASIGHVTLDDESSVLAYDALHDTDLLGVWLDLLCAGAEVGGVRFEADKDVEPGLPGRLLGAEQSNTSVVFADDLVLKLYRRLARGINPEIEIGAALTEVGSTVIAPVLGWLGHDDRTLGLLQPFYRTASEGWTLALGSVRSLLSSATIPPEEDGADFAGEAERLGAVTAEMHADLATALESRNASHAETVDTVRQLRERLTTAVEAVPELEAFAPAISAAYDELEAHTAEVPVQRVHGDYHLGQVLRVDTGWVVLDFEGEPARPLTERRALMSPLRDVAGMLRSFDYAAQHLLAEQSAGDDLAALAAAWSARNREAFCQGYSEFSGTDPREHKVLLRAFELDKAVYEAVYEKRYRPSWLGIPLGGIARATGVDHAL